MARRKAFTLAEILVCIGILLILGSIAFSVTIRAKASARVSQCMSNFHQYAIAIAMYREDWSGSEVGSIYEMGLPADPFKLTNHLECPLKGLPNNETKYNLGYVYLVGSPLDAEGNRNWVDRVTHLGGRATIMGDLDHNDLDAEGKTYYPHFGIGLNLDGTVFKKRQSGMDMWESWWSPQGG